LALTAVLLSACSTTDIDKIPHELGGLPAGAPARPADPPSYPAVHDMPPQRAAAVLDAEQQKKLEADLVAIRNRQSRQQKNATGEKAQARPKSVKPDSGKSKRVNRPQEPSARQSGATGQAASGAPPWPLPAQTTGGSPRP
jgi:hypothetical protein